LSTPCPGRLNKKKKKKTRPRATLRCFRSKTYFVSAFS
jgi:hypothetical protein